MTDLFWIVADPHLCEKNENDSKLFLKFLNFFAVSQCPKMFILGDLFSHWIATEKGVTNFQKEILDEIKKTKKEIFFLNGNRDYFVEELKDSPFCYCGKKYKLQSPSKKFFFFEHGETINLSDRKYLIWSALSRTNAVKSFLEILPKSTIEKIAEKIEENLSYTNIENKTEIPFKYLRKYSEILKEEGVETIFLGHFHKRLSLNFEGVKVEIIDKFFPNGFYSVVNSDGEVSDRLFSDK